MSLGELKYWFIRTPLEQPLLALRAAWGACRRLAHPELSEIYKEPARIDAVLRRALRPDSSCVDVGAHYGSMLSRMVRLAPRGRHIAVEAVPAKAEFLRRKFPEVTVHNLALAAGSGSVPFYVNTRRSGYSGMSKHGSAGDTFERIEVPCDTLDHLMLERAGRVDFVKVDVEGAEEVVLRGGSGFLARDHPLILFECGPSGAASLGRRPRDLFCLLTGELGYDVFFLSDWLRSGRPVGLSEFEAALVYPFKAFNWVAERSARAAEPAPPAPR